MLVLVCLLTVVGAAAGSWWLYRTYGDGLPTDLRGLPGYDPARRTVLYDRAGETIGELFVERRDLVPLSRVPAHVREAFLAAEDRNFHRHRGIDPAGVVRAAWANFRAGRVVQGASTITQQTARSLFLSREVSVARKVREAILALRLDRQLSKDQILGLYLNHVYLGGGAYGIQSGARRYFGKDVASLTLAEAALLAGLPSAPSAYAPTAHFAHARARQAYVLGRMVEDGRIAPAEAERARREPLAILAGTSLNDVSAPHFVETVRQELVERVGFARAHRGGLRVHTTLDLKMQLHAQRAVHLGLRALDRELGFRAPARALAPAEVELARVEAARALADSGRAPLDDEIYDAPIVAAGAKLVEVGIGGGLYRLTDADVAWARAAGPDALRPGRLVTVRVLPSQGGRGEPGAAELVQRPELEAALVALDPATGDVRAWVGGYDFSASEFDRVRQARRQPGSLFKLFTYAAAVGRGYHAASLVVDAPISVFSGGRRWSPGNYRGRFMGPVTLRTALAKSLNSVAVRLATSVGFHEITDAARRLGVSSPQAPYLPTVLGATEVTVLEMATSYAALANGGKPMEPRRITRIEDDAGRVLYASAPRPAGVGLPPDVAYVMLDLLKAVVQDGTARGAREVARAVAGKTGTSNDFRDAWFVGTLPSLACAVWVGRDDNRPIGPDATGGRVALPIWTDFVRPVAARLPADDFAIPPGVVFAKVAFGKVGRPGAPPTLRYVPLTRAQAERHIAPLARWEPDLPGVEGM